MSAPSYLRSLTGRLLASANFEAPQRPKEVRLDSYGDVFVVPGMTPQQGAAMSGSYFVGTNPTPGTEVVTTSSQTAYDQDKPVALLHNGSSERVVIPDFLQLKIEQVPTSATRWFLALTIDTAGSAYVSGGSTITPVCTHGGRDNSTIANFYFGAITSTDVTKRIILPAYQLKASIPIINDQVLIRFGGMGAGGILYAGAGDRVVDVPPIVLGEDCSLQVYLYGDSNAAAPTYEFCMGWMER